ncbi:MAG: MotA/TolQ/ExbB proton channel family protein [Bacteroidales bacterium]|jgi:biopolymer transport protein ExbB|nr:MotA/TolQ/ExbB proton channel family protein [Bacteroidales bacterium]
MLTPILLQLQTVSNDLGNAAVQKGEISLSVLDLAMKGGWIMIVLAVFSIITVYIFVERYLTISKASVSDKNFMNNIREFIHAGRLDAAVTLCRSTDSPNARMIEKGLSRIGKPLNDINAAIENIGKLEVSKLEKGVAGLATIAGAAPMLGFLGTVIGMIKAFYDMSMAGNNIDIALLSSGIYQAMITTVGGLVVGILAFIFYNILVSRIEKVVYLLEAKATEFMDVLHEPAR